VPLTRDPPDVLSIVVQVLYLLVYVFFLTLLSRFVLGAVLQYGRRWVPGRGASAALESVWSVTDPPLKALRRVIPPLRIGNVSLDLASLVLLVILFVLMYFVLAPLIR
jgi:YggT family protein